MASHSGTPRWVTVVRSLPQVLTVGTLISSSVFIYGWAIKPYQVRYYEQSRNAHASEVSVYAAADTSAPVLVSVFCDTGNLNDITYRPVLEKSRDWSLREMLPSVSEASQLIGGDSSPLYRIADPHLPGGLSQWEALETLELEKRINALLDTPRYKPNFPAPERKKFVDAFIGLGNAGNRHDAGKLNLPQTMKTNDQAALHEQLDRLLQAWENQVNAVANAWLQRWQTLTGASLEPTWNGVAQSTPVDVSAPALKQGTGLVVGLDGDSLPPGDFKVTVGGDPAFRVEEESDLLKPSILFAFRRYPWAFFLALGSLILAAVLFFSYRGWPKHLSDPELFNQAQADNSDELWSELRSRNVWAENYIVDSFFRRGAGMAPTETVILFFWRTVRDTLSNHQVPAQTDQDVREAILLILDRAIVNAIP